MKFFDFIVRKANSQDTVKIGELCGDAKATLCVNVASKWGLSSHYGQY